MLELLVETPRALIPPMHLAYARRLSKHGLAIRADDGQWYITAAGIRQADRQLH
ncbi:MAG: hypothetical protein AB7U75_11020 [Hyphomicrobiaceae bacterium]